MPKKCMRNLARKKISRVRLFCMMREIFFCVLSACRQTEFLPVVFLSVFVGHGYVDSNLVFLNPFSGFYICGVLYAIVRQYLLYHDRRRYIHLFHISLNYGYYAIHRIVAVVYYLEDNAAAFARLNHMVARIVYVCSGSLCRSIGLAHNFFEPEPHPDNSFRLGFLQDTRILHPDVLLVAKRCLLPLQWQRQLWFLPMNRWQSLCNCLSILHDPRL